MKSKLRFVLLSVFMSLGSTQAFAVCDGCVVRAVTAVNATLSGVGSAITSAIGATSAAELAAQTVHTNNILGAFQRVISSDAAVASRSTQMQIDAMAQINAETERMRAEGRYALSDPCSVTVLTEGVSGTWVNSASAAATTGRGSGGGGGGGGGSRAARAASSGSMKEAIEVYEGHRPADTPQAQAVASAKGACEEFASGSSLRGRACVAAGWRAGSPQRPDADTNGSTIFDGPQEPGQTKRRLTWDSEGPDAAAVAAFLRNIFAPLQLRDPSPAELATNAGRQYMSLKDSFDGRISMAERATKEQVAMRTRNALTIPALEKLNQSEHAGAFSKEYLDKSFAQWKTKGISYDDLMNLEVERRLLNPKWHEGVAGMKPEQVAKETLHVAALSAYLLNRLATEQRHTNIVLGAMYGASVRTEMIPQLMEAHKAVAR